MVVDGESNFRLWGAERRAEVATLSGHTQQSISTSSLNRVSAAYSPDDRFILTAIGDSVRL